MRTPVSAGLSLTLFGAPRLARDDGAPLALRSRRHLALLIFLATETGHRHSRDTLLALLWPEADETAARNNLRVALADLRNALGDDGALLQTTRTSVQLVPAGAPDLAVDVAAFRALLTAAQAHEHVATESCAACLERLEQAAALYGGPFLHGFNLPDSAPFQEWATIQREQLHQQQLATLETLAVAHELRGDHAGQVAYGRRLLALEPWREAAHDLVIRGLWSLGERGAALEQYEACRRILAAELGLEPSPELAALAARLRQPSPVAEPVVVARPPAPPPPATPPHNLPATLTALVGRDDDLERLGAALARPHCRLVTLTGPGGIGKTSLALELAWRRLPLYRDGVLLVQLAPLRQAEIVATVILQALGAKAAGGELPAAALRGQLRERHLLLVLDNCEHLLDTAPLVAELLAAAPGLTVLATSRELLGIPGEHAFSVPPLALPPTGPVAAPPMALAQYAAVTLFVQQMQAVRPGFTLTAENGPVVAELCTRLDGLPLAIGLAAARGGRLTPQHLLAQLRTGHASLDLLAGDGRDPSARQQTLRSTIAWSYELLSEELRALFRALSVFRGGWTAAAAEAIAAAGPAAAGLDALIDKSLVLAMDWPGDEPRYTMLETIRDFAWEQLERRGEAPAVAERHAGMFLALAETAEQHLGGSRGELAWWAKLRAEEDNLRAALQWALDTGAHEVGLRLGGALWQFWDLSNNYAEGRSRLALLLALPASSSASPWARAKALNGLAMLALRQADNAAASAAANASLALFRGLDDRQGLARALLTAGNVASLGRGEYAEAIAHYAEALALQRELNNHAGMAVALFNLGLAALSQGAYEQARSWLDEARGLYAQLGSERWVARIQPYLAAALLMTGAPAGAAALLAQTLQSWEDGVERDLTVATQIVIIAAGIAEACRRPQQAALLLGTLDPLDAAVGASSRRKAAKQRLYQTISARVSEQLGASAFVAARAAGANLATAQALAAAREVVAAAAAGAGPEPFHLPDAELPVALTTLVGRERELGELSALLHQPEVRLLTLVGVGGIGKTSLALRLAQTLAERYADGVRLVQLAPLNDAALVLQAVAEALDLREQAGRSLPQALVAALRNRRLLLILDNCEHLADACRLLVAQLLAECPQLTILATSREVLAVAGERVWHVPPLSVPDEGAAADVLPAIASVRLFVERAGAASSAFRWSAEDGPAIAQICRRLDGIPLAIELAAARVRHLSVAEIAARLDDRFTLLRSSAEAAPRRRTLRATIDWSYDLLAAEEQTLLRRLAVFAGGWTLMSAEAVCAGEGGTDEPAILDLLAQLVDKSLVVAEQRGATTRYRLLETVRAYAHERLVEVDELEATRGHHLVHFARLARDAEPHLFTGEQVAWFDRLALEHDNLRAAFEHAVAQADVTVAMELVSALRSFWYTRGHYEEARRRILALLALPAAQVRTVTRASALNAAAALLWPGDDAETALPLLDEALALARELADPVNIGWALLHQGTIAYRLGDGATARRLLEEGLASCREVGPQGRRGVAWGLIFLGNLALDAGEPEEARASFAESVELLRALSDYGLLAYPLRRLAHIALAGGDLAMAGALSAESLRLNQAIDDRLAVVACLAVHAAIAAASASADGPKRLRQLQHAACLCGLIAARLEALGDPLWPADAALLDGVVGVVQAGLGATAFAEAVAAGRGLTLNDVLAGAPLTTLAQKIVEHGDAQEQDERFVGGAAHPPSDATLPAALTPLVGASTS